jgi:hypothetical protein
MKAYEAPAIDFEDGPMRAVSDAPMVLEPCRRQDEGARYCIRHRKRLDEETRHLVQAGQWLRLILSRRTWKQRNGL